MVVIDTSSIKLTPNQIKAELRTMYINEVGWTEQDLLNLATMFENKYWRIQAILNDPNTPADVKTSLTAKNALITKLYFLIQKWRDGVRP